MKKDWYKALGVLKAFRALTVYPVFEDEKSNGSDKKQSKRKRPQDQYCYKL